MDRNPSLAHFVCEASLEGPGSKEALPFMRGMSCVITTTPPMSRTTHVEAVIAVNLLTLRK